MKQNKRTKKTTPKTAMVEFHLRVNYALNGEPVEVLVQQLEDAIARSVGMGALTGDTAAEVLGYDYYTKTTEGPVKSPRQVTGNMG